MRDPDLTIDGPDALDDRLKGGRFDVGPRPRSPDTQPRQEWYTLRLMFRSRNDLRYPIKVWHRDAPDFLVQEGEAVYYVEVTTATIPEEEKLRTHLANNDDDLPRPVLGGPLDGDGIAKGRRAVKDAYNAIIRKKEDRQYSNSPLWLLIYDNIGWDMLGPIYTSEREAEATSLLNEKTESRYSRILIVSDGDLIADWHRADF